MNETLKTIQSLRSIRNFSERGISKEDLERILEASLRTANSGGRQVYSIVVVEDRELLEKYFYRANKALVFCVDYNRWIDCAERLGHKITVGDIRGFLLGSEDAILAAQTATIAAKSLGIDSLLTSSLHREKLKKVYNALNLPKKFCFPLLSVCLGYPTRELPYLRGRVRKGVVHYNKYQRLSPEETDEVIAEYDIEEKHFTTMTREEIVKEGFEHYLDLGFSRWKGDFPEEEIDDCYATLERVGFFRMVG
ncbi:MAG: nitroreductase family protein [Candidatus Bathyarchaeota archaeon]|nr:MAG: nitroreductase family protein [Candidatus Bathyarchaeota archaeon]